MEDELKPQPLDALMIRLKLSNHDLVAASTEQLTHKMVAKGRKGKKLTPNVQRKILLSLQTLFPEEKLNLKKVFEFSE
ncbi:MAG: hypothetical protein WC676_05375 [Candidatus Omnitrophota bacterium]